MSVVQHFDITPRAIKTRNCDRNCLTLLPLVPAHHFGDSIAPFGDDVEAKFQLRIFQIGIAVVYVVGSFALIEGMRAEASGDRLP